ncbi:MAG: hypothetical protein L6408_00150 [Nanoarchaeota archaeon]|nr:hypothetical protein [Nanoarchaeota archaeon]
MVFVISLMFIVLFFSIQKTDAALCGDNTNGCAINPYNECDFTEIDCVDMYGGSRWAISYGDSTTGCWSGKCCGDDSGEYYNSRVCDNSYACSTSTSDRACCNSSSDCAHNGCYSSGSTSHDVDGDGDFDYCSSGRWYDCSSSSQCKAGQYCSSNDCLPCPCTSGACCDGCLYITAVSNTICRASAGVCDVAETCTGGSPLCPGDSYAANGTSCGTCKTCNSGLCNTTPADDSACGTIDCDGLDVTCRNYNDLTTSRCEGFGDCKDANTADCTSYINNDGTTCRASAGVCDVAETCSGGACPTDVGKGTSYTCAEGSFAGSNGVCQSSRTNTYCSIADRSTCTGTTWTEYQYASISGYVWWTNSWQNNSASIYCSSALATSCSGQQPQGSVKGCAVGSNTCNVNGTVVNVGSPCGGGENSRCVSGICTNLCSNTIDDDGDGYIDGQDLNCGGCQQCISGTCCNTLTGCFETSEIGCRASAGVCDVAEYCNGTLATCPGDVFKSNTTICDSTALYDYCNSVCQKRKTVYKCTGASAVCGTTNPGYAYASVTNGKVCSSGNEENVSASIYCSRTDVCSEGDCSGTKYYHSCDPGGDPTGCDGGVMYYTYLQTVYASTGYTLTSTCGTTGTTPCRSGGNCDPAEYCVAGGTCATDTVCGTGTYNSGSCVADTCNYSPPDCTESGTYTYGCGTGTCSRETDTTPLTSCGTGLVCVGGSCTTTTTNPLDKILPSGNITISESVATGINQAMGTPDGAVTISSGTLNLINGGYLIFGTKVILSGGHVILDGGGIIGWGDRTSTDRVAKICVQDADKDGYWVGAGVLANSAGNCATDYYPVDGSNLNDPNMHYKGDCNDGNGSYWYNGYADSDGDGYGSTWGCNNGVTNNLDCYDNNKDAKPGQTEYFNVDRGDGSFDFNCNTTIEYQYSEPTLNQCYNTVNGFSFIKRFGNTEYYQYCSYDRCGYKWIGSTNFVVHYGSGGVDPVTGCKEPFSGVTLNTRAAYRH